MRGLAANLVVFELSMLPMMLPSLVFLGMGIPVRAGLFFYLPVCWLGGMGVIFNTIFRLCVGAAGCRSARGQAFSSSGDNGYLLTTERAVAATGDFTAHRALGSTSCAYGAMGGVSIMGSAVIFGSGGLVMPMGRRGGGVVLLGGLAGQLNGFGSLAPQDADAAMRVLRERQAAAREAGGGVGGAGIGGAATEATLGQVAMMGQRGPAMGVPAALFGDGGVQQAYGNPYYGRAPAPHAVPMSAPLYGPTVAYGGAPPAYGGAPPAYGGAPPAYVVAPPAAAGAKPRFCGGCGAAAADAGDKFCSGCGRPM